MTSRTLISAAFALLLAAAAPSGAAAKGWESVKTERTDSKTVVKETEIEIKTVKTGILVSVTQPTQVKVFTILGQLVAQSTLQPGMHHLPTAHGIYIIKTGDLTCKVAI